jgi:hypothetical protein
MIRKSGHRFSLATNAERVCAEIMLRTEIQAFSREVDTGSREENVLELEIQSLSWEPAFGYTS